MLVPLVLISGEALSGLSCASSFFWKRYSEIRVPFPRRVVSCVQTVLAIDQRKYGDTEFLAFACLASIPSWTRISGILYPEALPSTGSSPLLHRTLKSVTTNLLISKTTVDHHGLSSTLDLTSLGGRPPSVEPSSTSYLETSCPNPPMFPLSSCIFRFALGIS
jgi:hypothetical protein